MLKRYRYRVPKDFDPKEYLLINEDLEIQKIEPFRHYARSGKAEGRHYRLKDLVPPDFDREAYLRLNEDVLQSKIAPEIHYYRFGKWERRLYKFSNSSDQNIVFDAKWYIEEYPEVINYGIEPEEHYKTYGRYEARHPRFDEEWYKLEYGELIDLTKITARQHYIDFGKKECFQPAFDAHWYEMMYPDVASSKTNALEHYHNYGRREGRHPSFNRTWYTDQYLDQNNINDDAFAHFMNIGRIEGNHPGINHEWYQNEYPDIKLTNLLPFSHYIKYGKSIGYIPAPAHSDTVYKQRLENFPVPYSSEYQPQIKFENFSTDIKAIAFYLPQFHQIPENDKWWGEGFTEWTNTNDASPRFEGHYQPRKPHIDIGQYDLSDPDTLRKQADIARKHGIYGFCFYHYWFSGHRLLERPLNNLISNQDIDIKFTICWANENWTRTWDGSDQEILIKQEYQDSDPINFIRDAEVYLTDSRYICIDGSPVLLVYKPQIIPDVGDVFAEWRRYWLTRHGRQLQIWCVRTDPSDHGFDRLDAKIDGIVEFPPHVIPHSKHVPKYTLSQKLAKITTAGHFYDYQALADDIIHGREYSPKPKVPFYRGIMLGWDNSARRKKGQSTWYGFNLHKYYIWLTKIVNDTRSTFARDRRFIFINAWNEWAEGTYLEPDEGTGYAALNTTSKALYGIDFEKLPEVATNHKATQPIRTLKILVHLHLFHLDIVQEITSRLTNIEFDFDVIVTTDAIDKSIAIESIMSKNLPGRVKKIIVSKNIGRDIGPMLLNLRMDILKYDIVGHFHTKKSPTVKWGDAWRTFLLDNLIGTPSYLNLLMKKFEDDPKVGLLKTPVFPLIAKHVSWGDVRPRCKDIMDSFNLPTMLSPEPHFPVGNMFWARVEAIKPVIERDWIEAEFEIEEDQVGGTLPHCIERIWDYVAMAKDFTVSEVMSDIKFINQKASAKKPKSLCLFVHYSVSNEIDEADLELLRRLNDQVSDIFVVSNSLLQSNCIERAKLYAKEIIVRPNIGLDFAAWRDLIKHIGWEQINSYDEVYFINNSCYGPVFEFDDMFNNMRARNLDFWGVTSFPLLENSNRPEAVYLKNHTIPRHIQSYFVAFTSKVVQSRQFFRFWNEVEDKDSFMNVVASYEVTLTQVLEKAGFKWDVFVPEAEHMQWEQRSNARYNAPYNSPYQLVLLKCPLLKKRAWDYDFDQMNLAKMLVKNIGYYPIHLMEK